MTWKRKNDSVFRILARYCFQTVSSDISSEGTPDNGIKTNGGNNDDIFYLDGQDVELRYHLQQWSYMLGNVSSPIDMNMPALHFDHHSRFYCRCSHHVVCLHGY